jgi:hypothetical protein
MVTFFRQPSRTLQESSRTIVGLSGHIVKDFFFRARCLSSGLPTLHRSSEEILRGSGASAFGGDLVGEVVHDMCGGFSELVDEAAVALVF